ncbi:MAG: DUF998 domain-containing protein [Actinobacteria bacterium]|nr:DUF998 domain-containing protein [Actinomycetota bacterium]
MTEHAPGEANQQLTRGGGQLRTSQPSQPSRPARVARGIRRWAWAGLLAQILFVVSWVAAVTWQGPRYSTGADSISDMYAETAPHAWFLIVVLTVCGAATMGFAFGAVRRALRPGGWTATVGSALLAISIVGLGDLLTVTERLDCRMVDPGCTATRQISNLGGQLDNTLSTYGVLALIVAGVFLSFAMRRAATWRGWAWPTRWTMLALFLVTFADAIGSHYGAGGLFERMIALIGAAWLAALAVAVLRRARPARQAGPAEPAQV